MIPKRCFISFMAILLLVAFAAAPVMAEDPEKININTATIEELTKLKGVGPKYAEIIVKYRDTNGPFETPEAIMNVKGIGQKTYEANKEVITIE